jgi:hypothetical protein
MGVRASDGISIIEKEREKSGSEKSDKNERGRSVE